ncbi:PspA/IM30 family protein [Pseudanabaena sp. FACHB-2040]|uniref:PspA/IM30 family protein n=1 Tax=Pseudanabaena sp. FACHB-2040 TaxID=2692859 RepID=UPI001685AA5A|nr:PspA/IM30 family protein [Pseudanabaena sp. FACHB-2040]MBD0266866.1 PspA/IM30 family protein [Cyanobacteria bacterium Co-bin8]MBD2259697.1 PspA/IM30 family protein [Pseudanabaena sp. FACHB-2040]
MGLLDRLSRVIRANLNSAVNQAEDPEKILEQAVEEMQANLIQLRQAVAQAIATQKRTERQSEQATRTAQEWYNRAQLALQKGEDDMAREALTRRKTYVDTATAMDAQIFQQRDVVEKLKSNMRALEGKITEAKTKKDMYIARARSAAASQRIQEMIGEVGTPGAIAAFDRMEERVMDLEARSEAVAELNAGDSLEKQFQALEQAPDSIDAELAAMRARLMTGSEETGNSLPPGA